MSDNVKHPNHYCKGGLECIDAIKSAVSTITDPFEAYCTGNIIKYIWRWHDKNGIEDLHKAVQYIDFIEQYRKGKSTTEKSSAAPTQAEYEEFFEGEEDVGEVDEGKYITMSDEKLQDAICHSGNIDECEKCPLFNLSGGWKNNYCTNFPTFRKVAIEWLEKEDSKIATNTI